MSLSKNFIEEHGDLIEIKNVSALLFMDSSHRCKILTVIHEDWISHALHTDIAGTDRKYFTSPRVDLLE